jgi:hypothetical protein
VEPAPWPIRSWLQQQAGGWTQGGGSRWQQQCSRWVGWRCKQTSRPSCVVLEAQFASSDNHLPVAAGEVQPLVFVCSAGNPPCIEPCRLQTYTLALRGWNVD